MNDSSAPQPKSVARLSRRGDAYLVKECLHGNELAWSALIDRYKRLIYSVPLKYRAGPEDAADIFQSVCIELFTELPKLRNTESISSWLITVTHRACLRWKRKQPGPEMLDIEASGEAVDTEALPSEVLREAEREQRLQEALGKLPPRCQALIRMLFFESPPVPYEEAARRLGLATGSIGFIRGRCLKKLQRILDEAGL